MAKKGKKPWVKWYWADWRSDPKLRMCCIGARGLWAEMLALMHEAHPYGHLLISGVAPTDTQLAMLAGTPSEQVPELVRELDTAGVFSRTDKGVIYSRRMVRDEKKARTAQKNGKAGGNPTLRKQTTNHPLDNPEDNQRDKPQRPDARDQTLPKADALGDARRRRGTRLPSDWTLRPDLADWAFERGLPNDRIALEAEKFSNYWHANSGPKATKVDWDSGWRAWIIRAQEYDNERDRKGERGSMLGGLC